MPLYTYRDKKSNKAFDILRNFEEYKSLPTKEEALKAGLTEEEFDSAEFQKEIGSSITVVKGDSWGKGKGHW
jgi:predicted nucleic acid-binding Zn ribbon protein